MAELITEDTEVRNLPLSIRDHLSNILDVNDCWKVLLDKILSPEDQSPLYKAQHVPLLQKHAEGPTKALIADWGTHGKDRPKIKTLISLLCECQLLEAADYLSVHVLKGDPVPKPYLNTTALIEEMNVMSGDMDDHNDWKEKNHSNYQRSQSLTHFSYTQLKQITNNFSERHYTEGGRGLGSGKFSTVYLGILTDGTKLAVKKLQNEFDDQLYKEIKVLSRIQHDNLLKLIAYSADGPHRCLLYEYMINGTLQDCLARIHDKKPLIVRQRVSIAAGVALGLVCLHNNNLIHRDVKSANILLDEKFIPKLGDFGIIHAGPSILETTMINTNFIYGTPPYIPEEGFRGHLSYRLDAYSYGVVILELLSGRKPINSERNDIVSYFQEHCSEESQLENILDEYAGQWDMKVAHDLFKISQKCLKQVHERPEIKEMIPQLNELECYMTNQEVE